MANYTGTVNIPSTHVYKNSEVLDGTAQKWLDRQQKYPIKIGRVEDIIENFNANYYSTDSGRLHPYYFAWQNSNRDFMFDWGNTPITFLIPEDDRIGLSANDQPERLCGSYTDMPKTQLDTDMYGFAHPASASGSNYSYGEFCDARWQEHNTEYDSAKGSPISRPNFIKRLKALTANSANVSGLTPVLDRGALLVPQRYRMQLYYQEYPGSGTTEGAYLTTSSSGETKLVSEWTHNNSNLNASFLYPYTFNQIRYKKKDGSGYTLLNAYPVFYDLWAYDVVQSNVVHSIYRLIQYSFSAYAFLKDDDGDLWILTVHGQSEAGTSDILGVTVPWYSSGDNLFFFLSKVKDIPTNSLPTITMQDRAQDSDIWQTNTTLNYVDPNTYDIEATWQELLDIQEGPTPPGPGPGEDPQEDIAESETGFTPGTHDWTSDTIEDPTSVVPNLTSVTKLLNVYRIDVGDGDTPTLQDFLREFKNFLYDDDLINSLQKTNADIKSCIISLKALPYSVNYGSVGDAVTLGKYQSNSFVQSVNILSAKPVTDQIQVLDFGYLDLEKFYGSYLDYSPYTEIHLVLPFIGSQQLDVDEVMDHRLSLKYVCDNYTGLCVAILYIDGTPVYNWNGNLAQEFPVSGAEYTNRLSGLLQTIGGVVSMGIGIAGMAAGGLTGGLSTMAAGAAMVGGAATAVGGANNMNQSKMYKNGNLGGNFGWLGPKEPMLIIKSPNLAYPLKRDEIAGGRVRQTKKVSDLSGFTQFEEIHVDKVICSDTERALIKKALMEGVIL